ncbi:MAG: hypothetical protein OQK24_09465 [Magnetovibrio sp.]|nr:hypothetical protein [Magnetovibrio sp.]
MMINRFSSHSVALSFVKTAADNALLWNVSAAKNRSSLLFTLMEKSDPDKAAALRKEYAEVNNLLEQLRSSQKDINERRRDAARQKIERLKAQIAALLMMASSDPEAVAHQVARLARELSAVAKEYASAGGSGASSVAITLGSASAPPAVTTAETSSSTKNPQNAAGTENAATTAVDTQEGGNTQSAKSTAQTSTTADDDRSSFREKINEQIADANKKAADRQEDADFVRTVRDLMNQLKQIIRKAQRKMQLEDGTSSNQNTEDAEKALRDTETSLSGISASALSMTVSVNITI